MNNKELNQISNIILKELFKYRVENQITFHIDRIPGISLEIIKKMKDGLPESGADDIKRKLIDLFKGQIGDFFIKDDGDKEWHAYEFDEDCGDLIFDIMNIFSRATSK